MSGATNHEPSVMAILRELEPNLAVEGLRAVPSSKHQRRFELQLSDNSLYELVLNPPPMTKLLRYEHALVGSEALIVRWMHESASGTAVHGGTNHQAAQDEHKGCSASSDNTTTPLNLVQMLPSLVGHRSASVQGPPIRETYSIFEQPGHGVVMAALSGNITSEQRRSLDSQLGRLAHDLAGITSPSGKFGPAAHVLSSGKERGSNAVATIDGEETWSGAFHAMLEAILRDGEDMTVAMPYSAVRMHFGRLAHYLDSVTEPRLVLLDVADENNVLVKGVEGLEEADDHICRGDSWKKPVDQVVSPGTLVPREPYRNAKDRGEGWGGPARPPFKAHRESGDDIDNHDHDRETASEVSKRRGETPQLLGLRDWSNCVFGDPLFARAFSSNPSEAFLSGFYSSEDNGPTQHSLVQDRPNLALRLLLYQAYHAAVDIVQEFYGRRSESSRIELAARRQLNEVLLQMDQLSQNRTGKAQ
ncbi:hypothetical protein VTK73DRAFT_3921 [Phialemonium thermophilum]|uniref:Aminoglycoside phosphotransferase domain-containing protein n=1 Tax=Phialemonium thermophilum TaxID=223376 RepID=A0ABR3WWR3_9PEZI